MYQKLTKPIRLGYFHTQKYVHYFEKKTMLGDFWADFFKESSGHTGSDNKTESLQPYVCSCRANLPISETLLF
jgi:hypothetical protein